jgi:hypothetical protein
MREVGVANRIQGGRVVAWGDHITNGKIPYGEPPGIVLHGTMVCQW